MTSKQLANLYELNRETRLDEERIEDIRKKMYRASSPNLSGLPAHRDKDRLERLMDEINDIEAIIAKRIADNIDEIKKLENYINSIENCYLRQLFKLHYAMGYSWNQVAYKIGGTTPDSVRVACHRYIKSNSNM